MEENNISDRLCTDSSNAANDISHISQQAANDSLVEDLTSFEVDSNCGDFETEEENLDSMIVDLLNKAPPSPLSKDVTPNDYSLVPTQIDTFSANNDDKSSDLNRTTTLVNRNYTNELMEEARKYPEIMKKLKIFRTDLENSFGYQKVFKDCFHPKSYVFNKVIMDELDPLHPRHVYNGAGFTRFNIDAHPAGILSAKAEASMSSEEIVQFFDDCDECIFDDFQYPERKLPPYEVLKYLATLIDRRRGLSDTTEQLETSKSSTSSVVRKALASTHNRDCCNSANESANKPNRRLADESGVRSTESTPSKRTPKKVKTGHDFFDDNDDQNHLLSYSQDQGRDLINQNNSKDNSNEKAPCGNDQLLEDKNNDFDSNQLDKEENLTVSQTDRKLNLRIARVGILACSFSTNRGTYHCFNKLSLDSPAFNKFRELNDSLEIYTSLQIVDIEDGKQKALCIAGDSIDSEYLFLAACIMDLPSFVKNEKRNSITLILVTRYWYFQNYNHFCKQGQSNIIDY